VRLSKLEMQGFKSFADDTVMVFEPGVTAIVGPNGCGKSNVSDAVRWVLGEQRARLLRGAKMEEVIFQGSSARRAVNVAEVSLYFENDDGQLPVAFREVVITRRLSRSGESEYLLNRAPCRLRDIHDLVRGTGLGADSGVVIESKMIDALLSDRPDDRRELFEEAAGVSLYRDRRRSTERKLVETNNDLSRLDDLLGEVQTQVRSLARQRRKTERQTEITARKFGVDLTLASREMSAWKDELARLEAQVVAARADVPASEARVIEAERRREAAHAARSAADARRNELGRLVAGQRDHVQQLRAEIAVAEERQRNTASRRERAEDEQRASVEFGARMRDDRARAVDERSSMEAAVSAADETLIQRTSDEERARAVVGEARAALEQAERTAREQADQSRRLELDREGAEREVAETALRAQALAGEHEQVRDRLTSLTRELETAAEQLDIFASSLDEATKTLDAARAAAREATERESAARHELFRAEEVLTALQARVHGLESLERERVGLAPAAAKLLAERDRFGNGAVLGPLSDFVTANASAALLVERFLGATVHAVVVRDTAVADAVREWHARTSPGALLLLPLDAAPAGHDGDGALMKAVEAVAPADRWVHALLGRATALDDGAAFVDARGAIWLPGSTGGPGPLRRRAELFALRAELATADAARRDAAAVSDAAREALRVAGQEAAAPTERAATTQQDVRHATDQQADLDRRRQRAMRESAEADALAERLEARRQELDDAIRAIDSRLEELRAAISTTAGSERAAREAVAGAEREHEAARERRTEAQVAQAQAQARLQVASDRERRLDDEFSSAAARLAVLEQELGTLAEADQALARQMADWRADLDTRESALRDALAHLDESEDAMRLADEAFVAAEHALDEARRDAVAREHELHHAELRLSDLSGRRAAIRERLETEWRRPIAELLSSFTPVELDNDELRAESDELRAQLDALGPVNPLAIEEHEEESRRLEFLGTQRADLADACNALQQAIREIDVTARELFLATFTQVQENFRQIFLTLFGGGECDLRLENPDAPLDCDIEIHASPRGKRTQRIHLLSSGERALVALSLLFGIFLTKPSPFCLLDEVDAPLDDANIGRFVTMLNQFKTNTQFLVITHNPRTTTEAADAVYGVTMQEPGVSSLVSVHLRGEAVRDLVGAEARTVGAPA
jgi:chromosome segregation protein